MIVLVIASRLLTPTEAGAYAVCLSFITVASTIFEFNIANYAVQKKELNQADISSLFGISAAINFPAVAVLLFIGGYVSHFLGGQTVLTLYYIMVPSILFTPFMVPALSTLRRDIRYGAVMTANLSASVIRAAGSITLLQYGWGPEALALSYTAAKLCECLVIALAVPGSLLTRPSLRGWREIMRFSSLATLSQSAGTIGFSMAELATGYFLGLHSAGLYNRGSTLTSVFRTGIEKAIHPIAFAAFSKEHRTAQGSVKEAYISGIKYMTVVGWPAYVGLLILSDEVVDLLFGSQWLEAVPVTQILCVACAIYVLCSFTPSMLMALGRTSKLFWRELIIQGIRIAAVIFATTYGIEGVAIAVLATYLLSLVYDFSLLRREIGLSLMDLWRGIGQSLAVTLVVAAASGLAERVCSYLDIMPILTCASVTMVGLLSWTSAILLLRHPIGEDLKRIPNAMGRRI